MVTFIECVVCFAIGYFVGARKRHKITQIGGDGAYQVGIINNKEDDDCANLPVW